MPYKDLEKNKESARRCYLKNKVRYDAANLGKKRVLLGMPIGTATNRLKKELMFVLAQRCGMDICFRCECKIETSFDLSVDHMDPWQSAAEPTARFFDVGNIAFSHKRCNSGAAAHPPRKHLTNESRAAAKKDCRKNADEIHNERRRLMRKVQAGVA